jgi:microcystin-dependent protein
MKSYARAARAAALSVAVAPAVAVAAPTGITGQSVPLTNVQPTAGVRYIVRTGAPTDGDVSRLGEIVLYAGGFTPAGWATADGRALNAFNHPAYFQELLFTYGFNPQGQFLLPDLRGRLPIGAGHGPGLPAYALGEKVGTDKTALGQHHLPAHHHGQPDGHVTTDTGGGEPFSNVQKSIALNFLVPVQGYAPPAAGQPVTGPQPMLGSVRISANPNVPAGFVPADGRSLSKAQNPGLAAIFGDNFGAGPATFNVPDLRGRAALGAGSGDGLTPAEIGAVGGVVSPTLTEANLPPHQHIILGAGQTDPTGGGVPLTNMQPSVGLRYIISTAGAFPTISHDEVPSNDPTSPDGPILGTVTLWGGDFLPTGWAYCEGQELNVAQNTALYAVLGSLWGGDGKSTFALPDLRGVVTAGIGQEPGGEHWSTGQFTGVEANAVTVAELPAHNHQTVPEPAGVIATSFAASLLARRRSLR